MAEKIKGVESGATNADYFQERHFSQVSFQDFSGRRLIFYYHASYFAVHKEEVLAALKKLVECSRLTIHSCFYIEAQASYGRFPGRFQHPGILFFLGKCSRWKSKGRSLVR